MVAQREPRTDDEELIGAEQPSLRSVRTDADRVDHMAAELTAGFAALHGLGPAVSVFGSARTAPESPLYERGRAVGRALGEAGFGVITGGGPGLMAAANEGARQVGAHSVGLTIDLPAETGANAWIDLQVDFHYFFTRKIMFVRYATAFVVLPGGFGTFDELFEALTLIQTQKVRDFPTILVGTEYWRGLVDWLAQTVLADGNISAADVERLHLVDDPADVVALVRAAETRAG